MANLSHLTRRSSSLLHQRWRVSQWKYHTRMVSLGSLRLSGTDASPPRQSVSILTDQDILDTIPIEDVRYFCFIAHVDHGKSSLASRVLELCGNLGPEAQSIAEKAVRGDDSLNDTDARQEQMSNSQKEKIELLDTLQVEQERGITVKASAATMLYKHPSAVGPSGVLLLNMVRNLNAGVS